MRTSEAIIMDIASLITELKKNDPGAAHTSIFISVSYEQGEKVLSAGATWGEEETIVAALSELIRGNLDCNRIIQAATSVAIINNQPDPQSN